MANKYLKTLPSLSTRKQQIKATLRFHLALVRMLPSSKQMQSKDVEQGGMCGKLCSHYRNQLEVSKY